MWEHVCDVHRWIGEEFLLFFFYIICVMLQLAQTLWRSSYFYAFAMHLAYTIYRYEKPRGKTMMRMSFIRILLPSIELSLCIYRIQTIKWFYHHHLQMYLYALVNWMNMKGMHVARANTCIPNVFVCECVCVRDQNHLHKRTKLMIEMFNGNVISAPCVLGASSSSSHFSVSVARNG